MTSLTAGDVSAGTGDVSCDGVGSGFGGATSRVDVWGFNDSRAERSARSQRDARGGGAGAGGVVSCVGDANFFRSVRGGDGGGVGIGFGAGGMALVADEVRATAGDDEGRDGAGAGDAIGGTGFRGFNT